MRFHGRNPNLLNVARGNSRNVPPLGFYDPRDHGGSWLTVRATAPFSIPFLSNLGVYANTVA